MLRASESKLSIDNLGPVEFIERFLSFKGKPFTLYPFQKTIARGSNFLRDKVAIRKGRQVGGSILVSALIVYYTACNPFCTTIIVSKTKDQASLISTYTREFFRSSPTLRKLIDHNQTTKLDLYLCNGSKVITRSAGMMRADTLRGHSIQGFGFLCFDESSFIAGDAIRNTYYAAAGGCGVVHCSTPFRPVGAFFDACRSPRFRQYHVPCRLSPRITAEDLAFWRDDMPASKYANEVEAEFAQGEDAVFSPEDIERAIDKSLPLWSPSASFKGDPEAVYHYSLDVSRVGSDLWTLTIGEPVNGGLRVVAHHAWAGRIHEDTGLDYCDFTDDPESIVAEILRYHKERDFHCVKFWIDTTSNEYFAHRLQNKYLLPVEPVVWSTSRKEKLISHLETCFKADRLKIPNADPIKRELLSYAFDWKKMQDYEERKLYLAGEDDWVSSLAMLAQSITVRKEYDFHDVLIVK